MSEGRPKLLVIGGPHVPARVVGAMLSERYDLVIAEPHAALDTMRAQPIDAVFAEAGDFLPLERGLVADQARRLLDALGEGVCLADHDGRITWANARFERYDPQTRARIGAVCRQAARWLTEHPDAAPPADLALPTQPAANEHAPPAPPAPPASPSHPGQGPRPLSRRYEVASADESRFYEVMVSPIDDASTLAPSPDDPRAAPAPAPAPAPAFASAQPSEAPPAPRGSVRHVAALVWEVTAMRRFQQKQAAIDAAGTELVRLDADQIRKMNTGERLRVLEQKIVHYAHDLLHFDQFVIRLVDEKSGKLELVMSKGLPPAAMELELYAKREGNGISGYVAASGRSYLCYDTLTDPRYVTGIEAARSSLTVPLRLADKVIGIFNVESTRPGNFTEEDRQFGEAFANHITLALHMLNLLVVERSTTGETVSGTVEGELAEPLEDIAQVAKRLKLAEADDPAVQRLVERISADVEAIRRRVKDVASGPRNILGAEKALSDAAIDPALAGKRVLVADDEPRIRQVIRDVLRARGAEVVMCEDGSSAIEVLAGVRPFAAPATAGPGSERPMGPAPDAPALPRHFDLLISDIKLPDKTGYEIFAAARKTNPALPVILMTGFGYDPHHSIVRASQEGLQCVLFKPFQAERLLEEVHKALARPRA